MSVAAASHVPIACARGVAIGAAEQHVPPYVIFHDATLADIARRRPKNSDALKDVSGVGRQRPILAVDAMQCVDE